MMSAQLLNLDSELHPAFAAQTPKVRDYSGSEWDQIASGFSDLDLFQTAAFCDPLRGRRHMSQFLVAPVGAPAGGAYTTIITLPGMKRGVAYVKHGPFWRRSGGFDLTAYKEVVRTLIAEYAGVRGHMLTISPRPHPLVQKLEIAALQDLGFRFSIAPFREITYFLVNTSAPEAELRASLSQSWRQKLKKAEKAEIRVRASRPEEALDRFFSLYEQMIARKQFRDRDPRLVLPPILQQLPSDCTHLFVAECGGEAVAAAVVFIGGDVAFYLHGASSDAALPLHAGYLLHWRIAAWLRERGVPWYNLGDGFGGIRQFKAGFAGKIGAALPAVELSYASRRSSWLIGSSIYGARRVTGLAQQSVRLARKRFVTQS